MHERRTKAHSNDTCFGGSNTLKVSPRTDSSRCRALRQSPLSRIVSILRVFNISTSLRSSWLCSSGRNQKYSLQKRTCSSGMCVNVLMARYNGCSLANFNRLVNGRPLRQESDNTITRLFTATDFAWIGRGSIGKQAKGDLLAAAMGSRRTASSCEGNAPMKRQWNEQLRSLGEMDTSHQPCHPLYRKRRTEESNAQRLLQGSVKDPISTWFTHIQTLQWYSASLAYYPSLVQIIL